MLVLIVWKISIFFSQKLVKIHTLKFCQNWIIWEQFRLFWTPCIVPKYHLGRMLQILKRHFDIWKMIVSHQKQRIKRILSSKAVALKIMISPPSSSMVSGLKKSLPPRSLILHLLLLHSHFEMFYLALPKMLPKVTSIHTTWEMIKNTHWP